jgi:hypothetical protein
MPISDIIGSKLFLFLDDLISMFATMRTTVFFVITLLLYACKGKEAQDTFANDLDFLRKYKEVVVLGSSGRQVAIVPSYQARVMTSTADGEKGVSFGWINYDLIKSKEYTPHINAVGGEERFWLGPEGGQYGLFFKKGQAFEFANWQTPAVLDTVSFDLINNTGNSATFSKTFDIENYQGTVFSINVERKISLLDEDAVKQAIGVDISGVKWIAYETANTVKNTGVNNWDTSGGALSIWLLSMLKSSPQTTMLIPYKKGADSLINDTYFGKVPAERLIRKDGIIAFKGDAGYRSKIGVAPGAVIPLSASYDAQRNVLTLIRYDYNGDAAYVNSAWSMQPFPYKGDVANAYNDGPNETGKQLGAFYELESSSRALFLQSNQSFTHNQRIFHFQGAKKDLDLIARKTLGISLDDHALNTLSK